jgi:hypothetical protein
MMTVTKEGSVMPKKYIVRLSDAERATLTDVVKKLKGSSTKVRRAQILLKADVNGPAGTDAQIAEAVGCRTKTVENVRERLVTVGFEDTLNGKRPVQPPRPKLLSGEQEAKVIALRWDRRRKDLPIGRCGCWQSRWWSWKSWNRSATRPSAKLLKKRNDEAEGRILGDPSEVRW